jgi:phosphoglycolate phosphatase
VFVIGDTVHDIAAARANRAVAIGVATGTTPASALEAAGADLVLESLEGAIAHFARSD